MTRTLRVKTGDGSTLCDLIQKLNESTVRDLNLYTWTGTDLVPVQTWHPDPDPDPDPELSPTVGELTAPCIFAHRAGGDIFPENTLYAAHKALADPQMGIEIDVYPLAAGQGLALSHDSTVDRTAADGSTGTVASRTAEQFRGIRQVWPSPSTWTPQVDVYANTWAELADAYGGRRLLIVEGKTNAAATAAIADITARGIRQRTLFTSFQHARCVEAENAGIRSIRVFSGEPDLDALQADGIWGVSLYTGYATVTNIAAANARGIKVFVNQVRSVPQMNTYLARGAFGFISDQPWVLAGTAPSSGNPLLTSTATTTSESLTTRGGA